MMRRLWLWVIALSAPVALVSPLFPRSFPRTSSVSRPPVHSRRCPRTLTNG